MWYGNMKKPLIIYILIGRIEQIETKRRYMNKICNTHNTVNLPDCVRFVSNKLSHCCDKHVCAFQLSSIVATEMFILFLLWVIFYVFEFPLEARLKRLQGQSLKLISLVVDTLICTENVHTLLLRK